MSIPTKEIAVDGQKKSATPNDQEDCWIDIVVLSCVQAQNSVKDNSQKQQINISRINS